MGLGEARNKPKSHWFSFCTLASCKPSSKLLEGRLSVVERALTWGSACLGFKPCTPVRQPWSVASPIRGLLHSAQCMVCGHVHVVYVNSGLGSVGLGPLQVPAGGQWRGGASGAAELGCVRWHRTGQLLNPYQENATFLTKSCSEDYNKQVSAL